MAVSLLGAAVGWFVSLLVVGLTLGLGVLVSGAIVGWFSSRAQCYVLRRYRFSTTQPTFLEHWVLRSTVGGSAGWLIAGIGLVLVPLIVAALDPGAGFGVTYVLVHQAFAGLLLMALPCCVAGMVIGYQQQGPLRQNIGYSRWWIPANALSGGLGGLVSVAVYTFLSATFFPYPQYYEPLPLQAMIPMVYFAVLLGTVTFAIVPGTIVIGLLHRRFGPHSNS